MGTEVDKYTKEYVRDWLRKTLLNRRIKPDSESLRVLREQTGWTPGPEQIRPSKEAIQRKSLDMNRLQREYETIGDAVLHELFKKRTVTNALDRKIAIGGDGEGLLVKNRYPYQVDDGITHYIMWYPHRIKRKADKVISQEILSRLGNDHEFVWYENPKLTIPNVYHVQVFSRKLL